MDAFFILRAFTAGVCAASSQPGASRNPHPSSKPHFGNRYTSQAPLKTPCKGCLFRKQRRFRHNLVARVSVISVYIPSNGVPTGVCACQKPYPARNTAFLCLYAKCTQEFFSNPIRPFRNCRAFRIARFGAARPPAEAIILPAAARNPPWPRRF